MESWFIKKVAKTENAGTYTDVERKQTIENHDKALLLSKRSSVIL